MNTHNTQDIVQTVHCLWTGGLDSTARIVELSRKNVVIQPYYVIDQGRVSTKYEMEAMKKIKQRLESDVKTTARINEIIIITTDEIPADETISNAWKSLNAKYKVGSQYDFLARYANSRGIQLEVGIEKGDGRAQTSIAAESQMIEFQDLTGGG